MMAILIPAASIKNVAVVVRHLFPSWQLYSNLVLLSWRLKSSYNKSQLNNQAISDHLPKQTLTSSSINSFDDCCFSDYNNTLMINYSQAGVPRLLMQFSRNEEVPKLVSVHEINQKQNNRDKLLKQARTHATHQSRKTQPDNAILRHTLQGQRMEKQELRALIKELTLQLEKLKEVNQGLIVRIKEVESSYRSLRGELQRSNEEDRRQIKNVIYGEVEEYVRMAVERLTINLKNEKMTPVLEDKLQRFMAELMQINSVSVQQLVRRNKHEESKRRQSRLQVSEKGKESRKVQQYQTQLSASKNTMGRQQYASIMQRLTGEARMSKSFAVGVSSASQDAKFRTVYATTPHKRRKIFD